MSDKKDLGSEFEVADLILPIAGAVGLTVGGYLLWRNRARITSAMEKSGIPVKLKEGLEKITVLTNPKHPAESRAS
ncbi:hypothetical protein WDW37_09165 [Bdellovibrionota bacterium FG-1]